MASERDRRWALGGLPWTGGAVAAALCGRPSPWGGQPHAGGQLRVDFPGSGLYGRLADGTAPAGTHSPATGPPVGCVFVASEPLQVAHTLVRNRRTLRPNGLQVGRRLSWLYWGPAPPPKSQAARQAANQTGGPRSEYYQGNSLRREVH